MKNTPLASIAYVIIIIGGLKMGSSLVVPLLMSLFWFLLFLPLVIKLQRLKINDTVSTIIVFFLTTIILLLLGSFLLKSTHDLGENLPLYQEKFSNLIVKLLDVTEHFGISLDQTNIINLLNPVKIIDYTTLFLKSIGGFMSNGLIILLMIMFLFLESSLNYQKPMNVYLDFIQKSA